MPSIASLPSFIFTLYVYYHPRRELEFACLALDQHIRPGMYTPRKQLKGNSWHLLKFLAYRTIWLLWSSPWTTLKYPKCLTSGEWVN